MNASMPMFEWQVVAIATALLGVGALAGLGIAALRYRPVVRLLSQEVDATNAAATDASSRAATLAYDLGAMSAKARHLEDTLDASGREADSLRRQIAALDAVRADLVQSEREKGSLARELAAARAEVAEIRSFAAEADATRIRAESGYVEKAEQLAAKEAEIVRLRNALADVEGKMGRAANEARLAAAKLHERLEEERTKRAVLVERLAGKEAEHAVTVQSLRDYIVDLQRLTTALGARNAAASPRGSGTAVTRDADAADGGVVPLKWTPELVQRFWNGVSRTRLTEVSFSRMSGPVLARTLARMLPNGAHVLDYGGGDGSLARHLIAEGVACAVFEPSSERRAQVIASIGDSPLFLGTDSGRGDRLYDAVVLCEVIEHVLDEELPLVLNGIRDSLRGGGLLLVTCPDGEDLELNSTYCPVSGTFFHRWQHVRSLAPASLTALLGAYGFRRDWLGLVTFRDLRRFELWAEQNLPNTNDDRRQVAEADAPPDGRMRNADAIFLICRKEASLTVGRAQPDAAGEGEIVAPFRHAGGHCYMIETTRLAPLADDIRYSEISGVRLYEDNRALGPAHAKHVEIAELGLGRYSHWGDFVYFSTSDNSDPNQNRRAYRLVVGAVPQAAEPAD